jgi:biotin-(acetyl-CoA carboxylase) ligase
VPAASLRTVDSVVRDRAPLLADLLLRLEHAYDAWIGGGLDAVFDGIGSRDFLRGRRVTVDGLEGVGGGLDRQGRLLVDGRVVESGEVELVG